MKVKTKAIVSAVTVVVMAGISHVMTPAAQIASNQTTVAQMQSSDAAYLAMNAVREGGSLLNFWLLVITAAVLTLIWTRKTK